MFKAIIVCILFCCVMCINNVIQGMQLLPKDVLKQIASYASISTENHPLEMIDNQMCHPKKLEKTMDELLVSRQNYSVTLNYLVEKQNAPDNIEKIMYLYIELMIKKAQTCFFWGLNKYFCSIFQSEITEYNKIKCSFSYILNVLAKDLECHMKKALEISNRDMNLVSVVNNNIHCLSFYTNNKYLFRYLDQYTNVRETIIPTYLYHALKIPDCIAESIAQDYAVPPYQEYYCIMLFFMLKQALERTNNSLCVTTDQKLNTYPFIIHARLDISVREAGYDEHNNKYVYVISKKNRLNGYWFIKKNTNQTCVIA